MRSSPTAAVHSSPHIRRPGESQFLPPLRTGGIVCLHCQSPAATPPRLLYPPAGEHISGPPSCSTALPLQSPDPAVPSPGCGPLSSIPSHHPLSPGAGVIPYIPPLPSGLHARARLCQHGPSPIHIWGHPECLTYPCHVPILNSGDATDRDAACTVSRSMPPTPDQTITVPATVSIYHQPLFTRFPDCPIPYRTGGGF